MAARKRTEPTHVPAPFGLLGMRDPFARFREEMDEVFSHYFAPTRRGGNGGVEPIGLPTSLDLSETDKTVTVRLDVPGLDQKDIDVSLTEAGLMIRGERRQEAEEEGENFHRIERAYGAFSRLIPLPCEVDADKIEARLKKGVLTIRLPKSDTARQPVRKIDIKSN